MAKDILTNSELIDSVIIDLNSLEKSLINGQFLQFCATIANIGQKLVNLRKTIDDDLKNREKTIETLKEELRAAGHGVKDMTPQQFIDEVMDKEEKDGVNNGAT